jgi:hypothetical protein
MDREQTIINALRVAARAYTNDAVAMREGSQNRLAEQFDKQAEEAVKLADFIENVGLNPFSGGAS